MRRWLRCDGLSVQRAISASLAAWRNALGGAARLLGAGSVARIPMNDHSYGFILLNKDIDGIFLKNREINLNM